MSTTASLGSLLAFSRTDLVPHMKAFAAKNLCACVLAKKATWRA